ncbi:MAG: type I-E CRISPR-associated protein Cse2/CasB [Thermoguttaceae bacterium]|nr:type I-E CRISPR-associated protein Cse2/CasB [Thermoguttaceae bacterium]MDW8079856.1 type I-E CRISPR-associated protein Cse2/CasB [Thermoguttaceae bacterium]
MTTVTLSPRVQRFIDWLQSNKEDRGVMANLRRALSEATEHYAWPHLAHFCDLANDNERTIFETVAACFAFHPELTTEGNLGTTLRQIALAQRPAEQSPNEAIEHFERRFSRLITATTVDELCQQLRSIIQLAKSQAIPVNYGQLLEDLLNWESSWQQIRVEWAAAYYGPPAETEPPSAEAEQA